MGKRKINKIILIIFIILLVLLLTFLILYKVFSKNPEETSYGSNEAQKEVDEKFLRNEQIVPEGYNYLLRLYEGNVSEKDIYSSIYKLVFEEIKEINDNLKDKTNEEIETYYETNKDRIYKNLGIEDYTYYKEIVEKIQKIDCTTYKKSYFDVKKFVADGENGYSKLELKIEFEKSEITFEMYIVNGIRVNKPDIKFILK